MIWWCLVCVLFMSVIDNASSACSSSTVYLTASISTKSTFTSPNYPSNYDNSANCYWRIDAGSSGQYVVLEFTSFVLESNYDYLRAYDGSTISSTSIGSYTGTTLPFIRSTGRYLTLRFTSDNSVQNRGFQVNYFSVQNTADRVDCSTSSLPYSVQAQLISDTFPNLYSRFQTCYEQLDGGSGNIISITVLYANFEYSLAADCANGGLVIYDGSTASGTRLLSLCSVAGNTGYTNTVYTTGQYAYIKYKYSSNALFRGFVITYDAYASAGATTLSQLVFTAAPSTTSSCSSQVSLIASETVTNYIYSPNYPSNYNSNSNCGYLLTSSISGYSAIRIEIDDFDLETCCDRLYIYDGSSSSYSTLTTSPYVGLILTSTGSSVFISFTTDGSVVNRGFSLSYRAVQEEIPSCASAYTAYYASDSVQSIQSPNYPSNYDSNSVTYWLIVKPDSDDTLTYYFESFRMETDSGCNSYDYLVVYNGPCETATVHDRYCGIQDNEQHTHTNGKYVLLKMVTDSSVRYKGFLMKYSTGNVLSNSDDEVVVEASVIAGVVVGVIVFIAVITVIVCIVIKRGAHRVNTSLPLKKTTVISKHINVIKPKDPKPPRQPTKQRIKKTTPSGPQPVQIAILPQPAPPQPQPPPYPPPYQTWSDPVYPPSAPPRTDGGAYFPNYGTSYPPPKNNPSIPNPFEYKPAY